MKKFVLFTTLALVSLPLLGLSAQDYRDRDEPQEHRDRRSSDYRQLRAELYQLNRMLARVSANLHIYGGRGEIRREYSRLVRDMDRLNYELQRPSYDRLRVHSQIDRIRDQLREIEVRLRVRRHYHWR